MTDSTLKTIVVLDPETQGYKPAAHNLIASAAEELVQQFAAGNRKARVLDQDGRHRTSDPTQCGRCKKVAAMAAESDGDHTQAVASVAS